MLVIDLAVKYGGGFCVGDLLPSLRLVDVVTGLTRRLWRALRQLDAIFDKIIAEHEARREEKEMTTGDDDLLSVLLRMKAEGELQTIISVTSIKAILFISETTLSADEWIMSELTRNPEVMAKAQAEVRRALDGKSPQGHEGQMDKLSYTRMVIKEGMRLHTVFPLLLPRLCRETCEVGGFKVAKGCKVIINAWAIARSPAYWQDPEEFKPERFDNSDVDYIGSQLEFIPFGSGRRMRPGNTFGIAALEFIVARLLYYFDWSLPNGMRPDQLDMDMVVGSTMRRKNHLHLVASMYKEIPSASGI
nr:cytochrome P450 CYP99A1-like [Setaria viridis]